MRLRRPAFNGARTPVATPRQSTGRLLLVGAGSAALAAGVWAVSTLTESGQRIADLILFGSATAGSAGAGAAGDILSTVTLASAAIACLGLATLAVARGGLGLALAAGIAVAGANLTSQLLKDVIERPALLGSLAYARGNSFPSGTVTVAASIALVALLVTPRRLRSLTGLVAAVVVAAVGMSTVTAGWHRLADVVGSVLIALAWTAASGGALAALQGWMPRRTWRAGLGRGAVRAGGLLGAVAILAGGAIMALAALDPTPVAEAFETLAGAPRAFAAALVIVGGTALLAVAALLWALRGLALELPE
jgi:membrane-associated phospholipid phosphatase